MLQLDDPPVMVPPTPYRWDCDTFWHLGELGLFRGRKVMLIDGAIVTMSPINPPHAACLAKLLITFAPLLGPNHHARPQSPLDIHGHTDPEPDLAVVVGGPGNYGLAHPTPQQTALLIEVAETSLSYDLGEKADLYASAAIADYWVVDLVHRRLIVHRDPVNGKYTSVISIDDKGTIAPLAMPTSVIRILDLLP